MIAQVEPAAQAERRPPAVAALAAVHVLAGDGPDPEPAGHFGLAQEGPADRDPVAGQPRPQEALEGNGVRHPRRLRRIDPLLDARLARLFLDADLLAPFDGQPVLEPLQAAAPPHVLRLGAGVADV